MILGGKQNRVFSSAFMAHALALPENIREIGVGPAVKDVVDRAEHVRKAMERITSLGTVWSRRDMPPLPPGRDGSVLANESLRHPPALEVRGLECRVPGHSRPRTALQFTNLPRPGNWTIVQL